MNTKLQELTDKIYIEGVEKGNAEAKAIVEKAEKQASDIIAKAQAEAAQIVANAEQKSIELSKNTQSELRLFAQQSVNALKTEITDLICGKIVSDSVKVATADKAFMQKLFWVWCRNGEKSKHHHRSQRCKITHRLFCSQRKGFVEQRCEDNRSQWRKSRFYNYS